MPTYEYICEKCGYQFEKMQGITAKSLRKCPKCGKSSLKRLIGTGAGVIFKGSGFYETDYRSESYKQGAKSETPAKSTDKKEATAVKKDSGGEQSVSTCASADKKAKGKSKK